MDNFESKRKKKSRSNDMDHDDEESLNENEEPEWLSKKLARNKSNKSRYPALSRPIILVCNDGFAKALFPLKDIVIKLKVPSSSRDRLNARI